MTNKLKPFDLQAALKGEPVMLRNGSKAFVRHHETELPVNRNCRLLGAHMREGEGIAKLISWTQQGRYAGEFKDDRADIIGMWPKTRIINGFEVPYPEEKDPEDRTAYYFPVLHTSDLYGADLWFSHDEKFHKRCLKRGIVFLNKEDAIANAKAMLGIEPYEEGEK